MRRELRVRVLKRLKTAHRVVSTTKFINNHAFLYSLSTMADNRIRMPSSGAGLTNFYEESKSKILISPKALVALIVAVIVVTILLNQL